MEKSQRQTSEHGAHSTFRKGLSDYNDGANVTDQLGNDEENPNFGSFQSGESPGENEEVGKVAYGNNLSDSETEEADPE